MNQAITVKNNIYWVGVNDRETHRFEGLWPIPHGVAYNSYLIVDEKVVLFDTVKGPYQSLFLENIKNLIGDRPIDYLVINHMEPDHSGSIKTLKAIYPEMTLVGNSKTQEYLHNFYGDFDKFKIVKDGDVLNIGEHSLKFFLTPMVHWPETMMTYEETEKVLFSGDAFGSFGTCDGSIFDDGMDIKHFEDEYLRYFSNIVAKYSPMVLKAMKRLQGLQINTICATHGPIIRKDPGYVVELYRRWSSQETEEGAVVVYGSMYGNTKRMAEAIAKSLSEHGIKKVITHDASKTHLSYILRDVWRYKITAIGACTYNLKLFPPVQQLIDFLENDGVKNHIFGIFGNYTWASRAVKVLTEFTEKVKSPAVEPIIEVRSAPKEEDLQQCYYLGQNLVEVLNGEFEM